MSIFQTLFTYIDTNMLTLAPRGLVAVAEKKIFMVSLLLMLLVVIPVVLMTITFAYHFRETNEKATYAPEWAHNTWLEVIWWGIPCLIIGILATITWISSHALDPYRPITIANQEPLTIEAIALDWKWLFIYPKENIASVNFLEVPVGRPLRFLITSQDAMNSFLIPQLGGQIYAMAGMQTKLFLVADQPGNYLGFSSNFSGKGFYGMKFTARATSASEYTQWVKQVKLSSNTLDLAQFNELQKPSSNNPVQLFANTDQRIYTTLIMQPMMGSKDGAALCNANSLVSIN